jgi:prophage antirepressor-like protein
MRLTNIQKREKINEFLDRPGSEVKTIRQVVRGLEDEGVHISDTLVKAVRAERAESPPVEPTPLFRAEVVEVDEKHSISNPYTIDKKPDTNIACTGFAEPVINGTQIQQFTFPLTNQTVRIVDINGVPHWIAKDVCEVLDYNNVGMAVYRLDDDEKGVSIVYTLGGNQKMIVINESGLWSLIMTSRKPEAKAFKKWVTSEVLPSIRKTGGYGQQKPVTFDLTDPEQLLRYYATKQIELSGNVKQLEEKNTKLVTENVELHNHLDALGSEVEELKPKAQVLDQLTKQNEKGILPREVAGLIGISQKELADQLTTPTHQGGLGLCYRIGKRKRLHPYSQYSETGLRYFYVALSEALDGGQYPQTYITTKGLSFIKQRFNEGGPSTLSIAR